MHTKRIAFLALLIMALWTVSASGQVDVASATLKGTITDQHDEVVPGATVTATSIDKGISRTATTGSEGHFQIPLLPPGAYKIEIEARGFNKVFNENVQLTLGQSLVYDVKLNAAGITAMVAIAASEPLIEVERTQQANTISTRQVENLPNAGRAFQNYVYTLPGVGNSTAPRASFRVALPASKAPASRLAAATGVIISSRWTVAKMSTAPASRASISPSRPFRSFRSTATPLQRSLVLRPALRSMSLPRVVRTISTVAAISSTAQTGLPLATLSILSTPERRPLIGRTTLVLLLAGRSRRTNCSSSPTMNDNRSALPAPVEPPLTRRRLPV